METKKAIEELKIPLSVTDKIWLAFIPVLMIVAVLFAYYITYKKSFYEPTFFSFSKTSDFAAFILFLILLILNIYHLSRFNEYSKLAVLNSDLSIEEKTTIVNSLAPIFKWKAFETGSTNYFSFMYSKYLLGMNFIVTILVDEKGFYINVGYGDFKLPALKFYKTFEKKIIKRLNQKISLYLSGV
jgi:heme/copper-type cytochrome/quinol oxidase subunit 2